MSEVVSEVSPFAKFILALQFYDALKSHEGFWDKLPEVRRFEIVAKLAVAFNYGGSSSFELFGGNFFSRKILSYYNSQVMPLQAELRELQSSFPIHVPEDHGSWTTFFPNFKKVNRSNEEFGADFVVFPEFRALVERYLPYSTHSFLLCAYCRWIICYYVWTSRWPTLNVKESWLQIADMPIDNGTKWGTKWREFIIEFQSVLELLG
jgi:hypothetical protein